jgi:phage gpG-like protein
MPEIKIVIQRYNAFLKGLPQLIADVLIDWVLDNFDKQSFDGRAWPDRKDRDSSRSLLVKTGRGRRSIRVSRQTAKRIEVTTDLQYMIAHNEGAEITMTITPRMRRFFWAMHYKFEADGDGNLIIPEDQVKWKWLALKKGNSIRFTMPQRQFIGPSDEIDRRLVEVIGRELNRVFN